MTLQLLHSEFPYQENFIFFLSVHMQIFLNAL